MTASVRAPFALEAGEASYDALGRNLTEAGPLGTTTYAWDIAGRRTRLTMADGFFVDYDVLVTGEVHKIRENGATSGVGVLATYAYDANGRLSSLTRGNGTIDSYAYDAASRLQTLAQDLGGTAYDQSLTFAYTPASQIASTTRSNDAFAWTGHYNVSRPYTANGLNQYATVGPVTPTHDARGNMTYEGTRTFAFDSENRLTSASGGVTLAYDPSGRLYQTAGAATTKLAYDGADLIAEYNASNQLTRRYVHGPGSDEPLVWYEGSGTSDRRFLHSDERGSVIAVTNSSGTVTNVNSYDEYGVPAATNVGRLQYTGQAWLPEIGMYHYKARIYWPQGGRFLQIDPIGYGDGMNMYAYVGGDPVNGVDPSGASRIDYYDEKMAEDGKTGRTGYGPGTEPGTVNSNMRPGMLAFSPNTGVNAYAGPATSSLTHVYSGSMSYYVQASPILFRRGGAADKVGEKNDLVGILAFLRPIFSLLGGILSLRGDTPKVEIYYHYGYASQSAGFANGMRPGSFGTPTGTYTAGEARRYLALPSDRPLPDAVYRIAVDVTYASPPRRVQPAYGQPGGGIEVTFPKGTPAGTVSAPLPLKP